MRVDRIHPDRPFYNAETQRWWVPTTQRIIVLTFDTPEDAEAWDCLPLFDHPWALSS